MNRSLLEAVVRHAEALTADPAAAATDADLVRRFADGRDEAAFAALVRRHGPMVWGVCRHLLPNPADAEDAFQATFLALVRSARSVRAGAAVGGWLHGVAVRVATKARRSAVRRRQREERSAGGEADRPVPVSAWEELLVAVHEEVQRLPADLRTAFVLCDLEGARQPDAAARLGWKPGTLTGRLARARRQLLDRLTRRGIAPAAASAAVGVGAATAGAAVPAELSDKAMTLVTAAADAVPPVVSELAREGLPMTFNTTKVLAAAVLVAGGLAVSVGAGWLPVADAQDAAGGFPGSPGGYPGGGAGTSSKPGGAYPGLHPGGGSPYGAAAGGYGADAGGSADPSAMAGGMYGGGGLMVPGMSGRSPSASRTRWEYQFDTAGGPDEFRKLAAKRGSEGWEYAGQYAFVPPGGPGPFGPETLIVFKRELTPQRRDAPAASGAMLPGGMGMPGMAGGMGGGVPGPAGMPMMGAMSGMSGYTSRESVTRQAFDALVRRTGGKDVIQLDRVPADVRRQYTDAAKAGGCKPLPEKGTMTREQFAEWYACYLGGSGVRAGDTGMEPSGLMVGGAPGMGAIPAGDQEVVLVRLTHSEPSNMQRLLTSVFGDQVRVAADARTNTLILAGSPAFLKSARSLITELDAPAPDPKGKR